MYREERYSIASQAADLSERELRQADAALAQASVAYETMMAEGDLQVVKAVEFSLQEQQHVVDALHALAVAKRAYADGVLVECLKPNVPDEEKLTRIVKGLQKHPDGSRHTYHRCTCLCTTHNTPLTLIPILNPIHILILITIS